MQQPGAEAVIDPIHELNALLAPSCGRQREADGWLRYFDVVPRLSEGLPIPIVGVMLLVWQLRPADLQREFPLTTVASRRAFVAWCLVHGCREYRAIAEAELLWQHAYAPAALDGPPVAPHEGGSGLSNLQWLLAMTRTDLDMDLTEPSGREQLLAWFLLHGREELGMQGQALPEWQSRFLLAPSALPGLNRMQAIIYRHRPDLRQAFPLPEGLSGFRSWFKTFIETKSTLGSALRTAFRPAAGETGEVPQLFGVNVLGHVFAQVGVGEEPRMAFQALAAAGVPARLVNFPAGPQVPQGDLSAAAWCAPGPDYSINLFCLTALEHARCFAEQGSAMLAGHYNIAYWPWELAQWPAEWEHLLTLADEIWTASHHTYDALAPVADMPLRMAPSAVALPAFEAKGRAAFGLPEDAVLFLFTFDLNSSALRKNPAACVAAFLQAFPDEHNVGLVIKIHPPAAPNADWDAIQRLQRADARIHLIEATLDRAELLALYAACDCFISLHRAEGFGRCMAEAMLLGKPVIATGYSGNLSYMNADNSLLVRYLPLAIHPGAYPGGAGQSWADADPGHAARHMRALLRQPELRTRIGCAGQAFIAQRHNIATVGRRYLELLSDDAA